jgi:hypothetical protein
MEFDAVIRSAQGGGALVPLPADTAEVFGTRARFPVRATVNDVEYAGSTMPTGEGGFCLGLTKAIRAEAGVDIGDHVHVVLERDTAERTVEIPGDLALALETAGQTKAFHALPFTQRKEYARWVTDAKKPETRDRRVAKIIETLASRTPRMSV